MVGEVLDSLATAELAALRAMAKAAVAVAKAAVAVAVMVRSPH